MALRAERDLAMGIVAERTGKCAVLALVCSELGDLGGMAGQARIGDSLGKGDHFRGMGILVAGETILQLEVRLVLMALAAVRDYFLYCRRMTHVTILAADLCFMFAPIGFDVGRGLSMTLNAIRIC